MNNVLETIKKRSTLRKYKDAPISKEDLDLVLESAMRAPTAGNMMMYSIIVVEEEGKKIRLSETCDHQPFIAKAPTILVFLADMQRWFDFYKHSSVETYCKENNVEYSTPDEGDMLLAVQDAVIAAQNAVIAAESLGIGSCYIGDILENYEIHKEMFNLPDWVIPISMLCLGYYPDNYEMPVKPRFDRKYIVFNEIYKSLKDEELQDMFKDKQSLVAPENKFHAKNFGQLMYARKTGAEFSAEMTRSVRIMLENWKGGK